MSGGEQDNLAQKPFAQIERAERIAELNDRFRKTMLGGRVMLTPGIDDLTSGKPMALLLEIQKFATFTEDNDPYGERDFGALEYRGAKIFWKIDYYDRSLGAGSPDPTDPSVTSRVLTVMRAEEY